MAQWLFFLKRVWKGLIHYQKASIIFIHQNRCFGNQNPKTFLLFFFKEKNTLPRIKNFQIKFDT
jgi:hypothetical protein